MSLRNIAPGAWITGPAEDRSWEVMLKIEQGDMPKTEREPRTATWEPALESRDATPRANS